MRLMVIVIFLLGLAPVPVFATDVGFEEVRISNGGEPPLIVGVWYPTDSPETSSALGDVTQTVARGAPLAGNSLPLVLMSHGGAG